MSLRGDELFIGDFGDTLGFSHALQKEDTWKLLISVPGQGQERRGKRAHGLLFLFNMIR
jgi:hypothetical protein